MEEDFTGGAIHDQPTRRQWSIDPPFDARVRQLVRDWDAKESPELIEEMIVTALTIARDRMSVADLKLINRSIKEMRNAAKVFAPFQHLRKVAVFGSARTPTDSPEYEVAKDFAREIVAHNFMVVTGGGDGIMGAAQRGAGRAHSFGLNIRLPSEQRANEIIEGDPKLITLNYFFTRKLNFVKEAHAFALFPGGFGTLDETFEVLTLMQTGKQCERVRLLHEIQFTSEEIIERNQLGIALNNFVGSLLPRQANIEPKTMRAACSPLRCSHNSVAPTCDHHKIVGNYLACKILCYFVYR